MYTTRKTLWYWIIRRLWTWPQTHWRKWWATERWLQARERALVAERATRVPELPRRPELPPGAVCAHQGCMTTPTHGLIAFEGGWLLYFCFRHLVSYLRGGSAAEE